LETLAGVIRILKALTVGFGWATFLDCRGGAVFFKTMQAHLVEEALRVVPNINQQILVNLVSRRVRQLNQGDRPLTDVSVRDGLSDVALKELIDGKLNWMVLES
jgi:DNA-directed RNA polymerase subunit omega